MLMNFDPDVFKSSITSKTFQAVKFRGTQRFRHFHGIIAAFPALKISENDFLEQLMPLWFQISISTSTSTSEAGCMPIKRSQLRFQKPQLPDCRPNSEKRAPRELLPNQIQEYPPKKSSHIFLNLPKSPSPSPHPPCPVPP